MASVTLPNTVTMAGLPQFGEAGEVFGAGVFLRRGTDGKLWRASNSNLARSVVVGLSLVASAAAGQWVSYAPPGTNITGASSLTKGNAYMLDHGTDEVQTATITGTPTGGTYMLSFLGVSSIAIAYNAAAATVQSALEGISTIGAGNVTVSGTGPYTITFKNELGGVDVAMLVLANNSLTGGSAPSVGIVETTPGVASGKPCPYADLVAGNYIECLLVAGSTTTFAFNPQHTGLIV